MDDVIEGFRAGDPDAVREVYRRHAGAVTTVARSILRDPQLVADAVQQTFLKAWRGAGAFDTSRDLAPWLYTIARRASIDLLRSERRPTIGDHDPEVDAAVETLSFERTWETFEVRQALDDLPDDEREVLRLSHLLGYSHPEIADRLNVPVGTVKSRSHRAHQRLAAALSHLRPPANRTSTGSVEGTED